MQYQKDQMIAGKKIQEVDIDRSAGREQVKYRIVCGCKAHFWAIESTLTKARQGVAVLRCRWCAVKEQRDSYKADVSLPALPEVGRRKRCDTQVTPATLKLIGKLTGKVLARVKELVAERIRGCQKLGAPMDSMDRIWLEAIESAKLEAKNPEIFGAGAYEPVGMRYRQYESPKSTWIN